MSDTPHADLANKQAAVDLEFLKKTAKTRRDWDKIIEIERCNVLAEAVKRVGAARDESQTICDGMPDTQAESKEKQGFVTRGLVIARNIISALRSK